MSNNRNDPSNNGNTSGIGFGDAQSVAMMLRRSWLVASTLVFVVGCGDAMAHRGGIAASPAAEALGVAARGIRFNMPDHEDHFRDDGWHVGDCLMKRYGAAITFYDDGRWEFAADAGSASSGDHFQPQWWVTKGKGGPVVVNTIARRTDELPKGRYDYGIRMNGRYTINQGFSFNDVTWGYWNALDCN